MGSRKRSPRQLLHSQVTTTSNSDNNALSVTCYSERRDCSEGRKLDAKCSTKRSHNTSNYFSLGKGLILILLLFYWICLAHGGYPGRGPPGPRGPPLMPHHPHPRGGPPRSSSLFKRRHGPSNNRPPRSRPHSQSDLAVAAQTLYDLRGYNIPFSGPENPRYHRQNDPFTLPTPLASNNARPRGQDTRTAPLVFPSFYQEQPTPAPSRSSIFGHNQHLSQTRFEPPAGFHIGGNSAAGKITFEQQSSPSSRDQFRPSQIDISFGSNQVTPSPLPSKQPQSSIPEQKSIPNTRASSSRDTRTRVPVKLSKNQQQDPFVYVYDEIDYDEGEEDFPSGGRGAQRTPQNQINNNRITPATSTTTAPLRSREPTIVPSPNPFLHQQPQYHNHQLPQLYSTQAPTKQPTTTQNSLFYGSQKDEFLNSPGRDLFRDHGIIRPPVTPTPRPNVEIVPSSERKPPPDQSNTIPLHITRHNSQREYNRPVQNVHDDLRRRPTQSTTTPAPQQQAPVISNHFQRDNIFQPLIPQQQGRQVSPSPPTSPVPYFPTGLDRRPFETNSDIPQRQRESTRNHFDQVVNLLQEEEEDEFPQNNALSGPSNFDQSFNNPSKLRPVNTIIPKNRIPKEDIILPPNFPFHNGQDITTTLTPFRDITQQRVRDNQHVTRIREEVPQRVPQRIQPSQPIRTRPPLVIQEEIVDNIITAAPPPSRVRGQTIRQHTSRTTTTTLPPVEVPQRTRTVSPRQRLRPNFNRQTTTTTTTSTTPPPTFVEYPSEEYVEDYEAPQQQFQQSPAPPQLLSPEPSQKPLSRFPPFPKKVAPQEFATTPAALPQRQRPVPVRQQGHRPGKQNRFRETTTADTPTSPRTTGKPLYTTGKMLSKEGGLYAGQQITSSHVYGHPVPNMPINSVLDRVPGVLDGRVILATTKPSFGSPQKNLRSKQRNPEHGPPSRIQHSSSHRLRPTPTARPQQEHSLDIVETVTLRPYQSDKSKSIEEPKRVRPGFIRGQQQLNSKERGEQVTLPRRRKVRPGQRRQQTTPLPPDPFTETVSIHHSQADDNPTFQTDRAQIIRETATPTVAVSSTHETSTAVSSVASPSPRSRRPRPRPGKQSASFSENTSERSKEEVEENSQDEPQRPPAKPVRKLRPRLRPVPTSQLNAQQRQSSEVVTQSSAQVDRKPTDAPGRFSSRFREESFSTSTITSPTQSLRGDDEETASSPRQFSPPAARPTFRPPQKKNQARRKPLPQANADGDELPDSIRLSPKDVIANRKPARRIPPGSASDRLKALQERRNKVFGSSQTEDSEQTAEGRQVPVSKRPRKPFNAPAEKNDDENESQQLPQPQRLRLRPAAELEEASGSKREVIHRSPQQSVSPRNELEYDNEENEEGDGDNEYDAEERVPSSSPTPQPRQVATARPNRQGFNRNRSVEVTSDEARSVLGIPRPAAPSRPPVRKQRLQQNFHDEEEEEVEEQRPRLQNGRQRSREQERPPREYSTILPRRHQQIQRDREEKRQRPRRPIKQQHQDFEDEEDEIQNNPPDYEEDTPEDDDREEPPRRLLVKQVRVAPTRIVHKKLETKNTQEVEDDDDNREEQRNDDDDDVTADKEEERREQERTTTVTTTSTSTSSTVSTSPEPPVEVPVKTGPQPIKQSLLKSRLRPNRRLLGGGGSGNGKQPRVSVSQSSTASTRETTTPSQERQHGLKHGTIHVSKSPRPRISSSSSGKRSSKKFVAMATENPSLPLEDIFPEMA